MSPETSLQTSLVNVRGAARQLGVSPSLVYKLTESNELPHFRVGRSIRFSPSDLRHWLESRRFGPQA